METKAWDPAEHLDSEEAVTAYINAAFEDGDPSLIAAALGDIAPAREMSELARRSNLSREDLYRALNANGNPEFSTVLKVMKALGMTLSASPANKAM